MSNVSVIIPCYDHGQFIGDAIDSVMNQTYRDFEIIVVNDGSTDPYTNRLLESYQSLCRVIVTKNRGVGAARNTGIAESTGSYILPLDADDKIADSYLEKAVAVLDSNANVGIVYCHAEFFGEKTGKWELPEYSFPEILLRNVIFCSGFYRKNDWQAVNGYNANMKCWADYDLWLSLIELGREVVCLPETLFFYRQRSGSMNKSITLDQMVASYEQLFRNHSKLYSENIAIIFRQLVELQDRLATRLKSQSD
jgi:glycosyltransferase involved in cell wall biosynthesis